MIQRVLELKAKTSVEEAVKEEKYVVDDAVEEAVEDVDEHKLQAEALVVEDAANDAKALFVGTSTINLKKACYHLAFGRKCFKGDKCGFSHDDDDVQRFKKILEGRKKEMKCHKCGQMGHVKAQCKTSKLATQGSIDDAKMQTTKTTLAHEDSVEVLMNKLRGMKNGKVAVRAMAMEVEMTSDDGSSERRKRRVVQANTVVVNRLYSHVVEGRARPATSNNRLSENDDCDERFERDTKRAIELSLMSMKNESKVMDVVPYGTVNGLRENVPMPYEDMDMVFTVHYMNYDDEDEKECELGTSTQKAGRYRQSIEKAKTKQKRRQERKDSSKKETEKLQRKEKNKRRNRRNTSENSDSRHSTKSDRNNSNRENNGRDQRNDRKEDRNTDRYRGTCSCHESAWRRCT